MMLPTLIIDDFIPKAYQEEIKNTLFSENFPWSYISDVTFNEKNTSSNKSPACAHLFRRHGKTICEYYKLLEPMAFIAAEKAAYTYGEVLMCRSFLQLPIHETKIADLIHIDVPYDHLVCLYYVIDADGDTLIVDKTRSGQEEEFNCSVNDYNILHRVTPKQGRAVLFDGRYYHTAEQPINDVRCIINFDILGAST